MKLPGNYTFFVYRNVHFLEKGKGDFVKFPIGIYTSSRPVKIESILTGNRVYWTIKPLMTPL
jgi:hypothetical protein